MSEATHSAPPSGSSGFPQPSAARTARGRLGRAARVALCTAGALALLCAYPAAIYSFATEHRDDLSIGTALANLREVDPGRFYRSGQLGPEQLREVISERRIRTVINLRGYDTSQPWYRAQAEVTGELGVKLYNVHLSASGLPHPQELDWLLHIYRHVKRPILVHCDGGADRAGEASALYQIEYMGKSNAEALDMLSLRYRHFSWLRPAKRYFIGRYRGEQWARESYDPCAADFDYYDKRKHCS